MILFLEPDLAERLLGYLDDHARATGDAGAAQDTRELAEQMLVAAHRPSVALDLELQAEPQAVRS